MPHLVNWPSPCHDPARASCARAAHDLPTRGPLDLPMSCTPPTSGLGAANYPPGYYPAPGLRMLEAKVRTPGGLMCNPHPQPCGIVGRAHKHWFVSRGLSTLGMELHTAPRALRTTCTGDASRLRASCVPTAQGLRIIHAQAMRKPRGGDSLSQHNEPPAVWLASCVRNTEGGGCLINRQTLVHLGHYAPLPRNQAESYMTVCKISRKVDR
jgi:hypothetical protein